MSKVNKDRPVYIRVKMVNGATYYVLCNYFLGDTNFFNFALGTWECNLAKVHLCLDLKNVIAAALEAGFKEVIEVSAFRLTDDSIQYLVKKYNEKRGVDFPMYLFVDFENREYKWLDLRFWYKTENEAVTAVNDYPGYRKMRLTESVVEAKASPSKVKKPKKARPPSETRKLEKEIIETVKKRRLACISLAESAEDPSLRSTHAQKVVMLEQTLKALKARFPKWVLTWERQAK